jgi:hypothetical protein
VDPEDQYYDGYLYCSDNPVLNVDPDGGWDNPYPLMTNAFIDQIEEVKNSLLKAKEVVDLVIPTSVQVGMQIEDGDYSGAVKTAAIGAVGGGYLKPLRHSKMLKKIVNKMSAAPIKIIDKKIAQLKRVIFQAGGKTRTERGIIDKSSKPILHTQTEGLGSRTDGRHIVHDKQ